jgi:glycosyltransferase involved in cell wall biosynthesis
VQNLDFSGANQVVLNIVSGHLHESNVIVLAPKVGSFAARFVETGAAVRFGNLSNLLDEIKDVFCIICNTIMTAQHVVDMAQRPHPVIWILHEWWDDEMIKENLRIRNLAGMNLDTVKQALKKASCVVFVCEAQRSLYKPQANSAVIYVGVPAPLYQPDPLKSLTLKHKLFTFLCLGIVCPRKNQVWAGI